MVFINTNNTHYNITEDDIPVGSDICSDYSWSVRTVYGELASEVASGNDNITIPSSPMIESDSFYTNFSECMNSFTLSTFIKIHSCLNVLQYNMYITVTVGKQTHNVSSTTIITDDNTNNIYVVKATYVTQIEVANELLNGSVMICASNQYNNGCVMYELQDYSVDILSCVQPTMESQTTTTTTIPTTITTTTGSLASTISSSIIINTVTDTPLLPSVSLTDKTPLSQTSVYIYIIISMVAAIIIGNIIVCTIIIIIMVKRRKRNVSLEATSLEGYSAIIKPTIKDCLQDAMYDGVEEVVLQSNNAYGVEEVVVQSNNAYGVVTEAIYDEITAA